MANVTTTAAILSVLDLAQQSIARYGYSLSFLLGNLGSFLNVLVLIRRNYLQNSCSSYILASTVPNLLVINVVILTRIFATFGLDLTRTSLWFCKFQWYIAHSMTLLSRTYVLLACIDGWAMTSRSVQWRALARIKISILIIPSAAFFWSVVSFHVIRHQKIITRRCGPDSDRYAIFFSVYNTVIAGLLIPILMCGFGMVTIRNVRELQIRAAQRMNTARTGEAQQEHRSKLAYKRSYDYQLLFMVLVQISVYVITTLPFIAFSLYSVLSIKWVKSSVHRAIDNVLSALIYTLVLTNFCVTFYIYVLTSQTFRKNLVRQCKRICACHRFLAGPQRSQLRPLPHTQRPMETCNILTRRNP